MLIGIKANVRVGGGLAAIARVGKLNPRTVFVVLSRPLHGDQTEHKIKQSGPRGPWAPLASTTLERYARMGLRRNRKILNRLPDPRQTKLSSKSLIIKSRVKWSMVHQDGPTRVGHGAVVPQRQFFWISKQMIRMARREFRRAMIARWLGRRYP